MPIGKARLRISDYNEQRKARNKGKEHRIRQISLSLTSMVDMFAILVIFLLTNTSSVAQWMEIGHDINLPKARHSDQPVKAATLQVAHDGIYGDSKFIVESKPVATGPLIIGALKTWLGTQEKKDGYINIVGDEKVSFGLIKRVVATCQEAGFGNVNLAVQPR